MSKDKNSKSDIDKLVEKVKKEIPSVDVILDKAIARVELKIFWEGSWF